MGSRDESFLACVLALSTHREILVSLRLKVHAISDYLALCQSGHTGAAGLS